MKKILSLILAITVFITDAVFVSAAEKCDVDADGTVTATDARLALRASVGLETLTDEQKTLADADGNGSVEAADARAILRLSVGLTDDNEEEEQPTQKPEEKPVQKPVHTPSEKEKLFYTSLYETAHPLLGSYPKAFENSLLKNFQKWCAYYTIAQTFRPALEKAGYSKADVDRLAPRTFSKDSVNKILNNATGSSFPSWLVVDSLPLYVPSLLADYYIKNPKAADVYFLYDFYDDMVELTVYEHSDEDRENYVPRVGDVLFISNKAKTFVNGYPTVDHTAQIIEILSDGTFICTEGSLIDANDETGMARVQERRYMYDAQTGSYCYRQDLPSGSYIYRNIVVLYAAQPKL